MCSPANFDVKGVLPCQNTGEMLPSNSTDQQVKGVLHGNEYKCNWLHFYSSALKDAGWKQNYPSPGASAGLRLGWTHRSSAAPMRAPTVGASGAEAQQQPGETQTWRIHRYRTGKTTETHQQRTTTTKLANNVANTCAVGKTVTKPRTTTKTGVFIWITLMATYKWNAPWLIECKQVITLPQIVPKAVKFWMIKWFKHLFQDNHARAALWGNISWRASEDEVNVWINCCKLQRSAKYVFLRSHVIEYGEFTPNCDLIV